MCCTLWFDVLPKLFALALARWCTLGSQPKNPVVYRCLFSTFRLLKFPTTLFFVLSVALESWCYKFVTGLGLVSCYTCSRSRRRTSVQLCSFSARALSSVAVLFTRCVCLPLGYVFCGGVLDSSSGRAVRVRVRVRVSESVSESESESALLIDVFLLADVGARFVWGVPGILSYELLKSTSQCSTSSFDSG